MKLTRVLTACAIVLAATAALAQDRETKVRDDRRRLEADESWVYNDLEQAIEIARGENKPLLVAVRCIPCEACAEFDDQVVRRDPEIRNLMDQFVCVRIVQTNGMDLEQFQFDYDLSFSVLLMNADGTMYGRYGSRSDLKEAEKDISMVGFRKTLEGALKLHGRYPDNKRYFAGKQGHPVDVKRPELLPSLKGKYGPTLDYDGQVVRSCIHCHQVRDAQRLVYRSAGEPLPPQQLFPNPGPNVLGIALDPRERATVASVAPDSIAESAGMQVGDEILTLDGQAILSIADVQWVLHGAGETAELPALVRRDGKSERLALSLPEGWRQRDDLSWRVTTWELRRMGTGGLVLETATDEQRRAAGLDDDESMALRVKYVGQYNEHAVGKNAGFREGDLIVQFGERTDLERETDLLAYAVQNTRPGEKVKVTVLRGRQRTVIELPMQ